MFLFFWCVFRTSPYTVHFQLHQQLLLYNSQDTSEQQPAVSSSRGAPVSPSTGSQWTDWTWWFHQLTGRWCRHCGQIFVFWDTGQTAESDMLAGTWRKNWVAKGWVKMVTLWIRCFLNLQQNWPGSIESCCLNFLHSSSGYQSRFRLIKEVYFYGTFLYCIVLVWKLIDWFSHKTLVWFHQIHAFIQHPVYTHLIWFKRHAYAPASCYIMQVDIGWYQLCTHII